MTHRLDEIETEKHLPARGDDQGSREPREVDVMRAANQLHNLQELRAGLEHELRSPLNAIVLNLALLEELVRSGGGSTAVVQLERLKVVSESVQRLQAGLAGLLDETETGQDRNPRREVIDLVELAAGIAQLAEAELRQRGCRLSFGTEGGAGGQAPRAVSVKAQRDRLRCALLNLLVNAMLASRDGGTIQLTVGRIGGAGAGRAWIEVADEGSGMDESMQESAFDAGTSTWDRAGLGLFLARQFVTAEGGSLELKSTGDSGTTFRIEIPEGAA